MAQRRRPTGPTHPTAAADRAPGARVLVAYASKYGSTAEIARWIGDALTGERLRADVRPAAEVGDVAGYDAVVLGSGLYAGHWLRDACRFARRHREALLGLPVWLFSSGPLDPVSARYGIEPTREVTRIAERVHAADHMTFGGRLVDDARGFLARRLVAQGDGGDFCDPRRIREWALDIADTVRARPAP
ncbi:flavodoxin domain-containing protein [Actinacidiphila sp. ITFR-21]|uniref:flavodoxin domain-containing protein n=1 Tax=Actinacidiphila sp. ITFR-21 TaxID=3075199 RepID=UPI0028895FD7|nr:flavodoxin domain-containing protein [Streptomyces sp. ITFR-21]WNI14327.1 flavodoxin domain-containing protein [Streptomyces sp. ITFR-21]